MMQLRAQITVDVDADDFIAAAEYQKRFEKLIQMVRQEYAGAHLDLKERRGPTAVRSKAGASQPPQVRHITGNLSVYEDV